MLKYWTRVEKKVISDVKKVIAFWWKIMETCSPLEYCAPMFRTVTQGTFIKKGNGVDLDFMPFVT